MGDGKLEEIEMMSVTHNMPPQSGHPSLPKLIPGAGGVLKI